MPTTRSDNNACLCQRDGVATYFIDEVFASVAEPRKLGTGTWVLLWLKRRHPRSGVPTPAASPSPFSSTNVCIIAGSRIPGRSIGRVTQLCCRSIVAAQPRRSESAARQPIRPQVEAVLGKSRALSSSMALMQLGPRHLLAGLRNVRTFFPGATPAMTSALPGASSRRPASGSLFCCATMCRHLQNPYCASVSTGSPGP